MPKLYLTVFVLLVFLGEALGQPSTLLQTPIQLEPGQYTVAQLLKQINNQTGVHFSYSRSLNISKKVLFTDKTLSIKQIVDQMLAPQKLKYLLKGKMIIIRKSFPKIATPTSTTASFTTQPRFYTISGTITDQSNGEALIGATVYIPSLGKGIATNSYGFFALRLAPGKYKVQVSYIGFQSKHYQINLEASKTLNVELPVDKNELATVVITDRGINEHVTSLEVSTNRLDIEEIKSMPAFLGEVDVLQSIRALPGVSSIGEGASGFNVRGGAADQNLILLDEAIVYNSAHLLGLFSVFNPHSVKDVKIYKGAIPPNYGGRLSSVLDIRQKEGNTKRFSGEGGVGFVTSRLMLETPIVKDKSALLVAARRSYADLFLKLSSDQDIRDTQLYFYDLNLKFNYAIDKKNRLYVSGYFGRDVAKIGKLFSFSWGNRTATIRWNHLFNSQLFSNVSLIFSDYNYKLGVLPTNTNGLEFEWVAGISSYQLKNDLTWFINPRHTLDFGISGIGYYFQPGQVDSETSSVKTASERALETAIYANYKQQINKKLTLSYGVRLSAFLSLGERNVRTYLPGQPRRNATVIGQRRYGNNEVVANYWGLEPRLSLRWQFKPKTALKASYARNRQYIHLVSNTTAPLPTDIWKSSDPYIRPLTSDQVALGIFHVIASPALELSAEVYYKKMYDLIDYRNGVNLLLNEYLETELLSGDGRAYGLELMVRKNTGKFRGWLSYTLARSERKIDSDFPEDRVNNGAYYPADYDRTHLLNLTTTYDFNKRVSLSANFTLSTGRPVTFPSAKYQFMGSTVLDYSTRNQNRIPSYHRLDLSLTLKGKPKRKRRWKGEWVFSVYNVYARRNAYSIYFIGDGTAQNEATRLSILGGLFPSITYNFKF
ncbi:TonB-dependent receptor [Microscilla marina]|uniref:TonB-dependent receptor n=1 Tax=Microscilla marina TaxID=1027 RepID=UPI001E32CA93|nr:TonB-dependent receptor [Microscilla marina]